MQRYRKFLNEQYNFRNFQQIRYNKLIFSDKKFQYFERMSVVMLAVGDVCVFEMIGLKAKTRLAFARVYVYRLRGGKPSKPPLLCKAGESIRGK